MTINSTNASTPAADDFALISNSKLLALYAAMVECRRLAHESTSATNQRGKIPSITGHVAALVGIAIDLAANDVLTVPQWPEPILRTVNSNVILDSRIQSAARSLAGSDSSRKLAVILHEGKPASSPPWEKARSLARAKGLPILFVSVYRGDPVPALDQDQHPPGPGSFGFPSITVDGNDVVAVYRVASESIAHARKGHGPTLIECPLAAGADPVRNMEAYLHEKGLLARNRT